LNHFSTRSTKSVLTMVDRWTREVRFGEVFLPLGERLEDEHVSAVDGRARLSADFESYWRRLYEVRRRAIK
jgi:hypothetical protein